MMSRTHRTVIKRLDTSDQPSTCNWGLARRQLVVGCTASFQTFAQYARAYGSHLDDVISVSNFLVGPQGV